MVQLPGNSGVMQTVEIFDLRFLILLTLPLLALLVFLLPFLKFTGYLLFRLYCSSLFILYFECLFACSFQFSLIISDKVDRELHKAFIGFSFKTLVS